MAETRLDTVQFQPARGCEGYLNVIFRLVAQLNHSRCRLDTIKEATVSLGAVTAHIAIVHGIRNVRQIADQIKAGEVWLSKKKVLVVHVKKQFVISLPPPQEHVPTTLLKWWHALEAALEAAGNLGSNLSTG